MKSIEKNFKNKVALVTGGAFGIGKATAIAFAKKGAKVVIVDKVKNCETYNIIKEMGSEVLFVECDVSKPADVKMMVEKTIEKFGRLDYAYNNEGIECSTGKLQDSLDENRDKTINFNLKSVDLCMKYEIPEIIKQSKGAIVNCASITGLDGFEGVPAYVESKHAVIGFTKTSALECAKLGVRVNVVCPGVIKTPMIDKTSRNDIKGEKQFADMDPMGRLGDSEEVANAVMWLCSEEASFVTGHAMAVNGTWTS